MGTEFWLIDRLIILIPIWLSLTVHEWAHARSAYALGDDTAYLQDRMTLNPLAHIDPIGTVCLPLLGVPFGWARPVPVNPNRFHRGISMGMGSMLVALAGPVSNVFLGVSFAFAYAILNNFVGGLPSELYGVLFFIVYLNFILAAFNMIPIPPLDGSYVADLFMPRFLRPVWDVVSSFGLLVILAIIFVPQYLGVNIFGSISWFTGAYIKAVSGLIS